MLSLTARNNNVPLGVYARDSCSDACTRMCFTLPSGSRWPYTVCVMDLACATISPAGAAVINARTVFFTRRSICKHNSEDVTSLAWFLIEHYRDCFHKSLLDAVEEENARMGITEWQTALGKCTTKRRASYGTGP
jgi:hypothetical protein